ncbi:dnaA protein helix-turn-helix [Geoalkalibacter ferrihydriticus]|uniref:DnaA protein helix-turn-helix n=1 Tax=Geoalkalibacter ferrihydriticus TaxID=392333 RepID=A0A1G9REG4_9BACT|nr:helix-turn-helix domain-containing protein [Geoalkalibacter ferrihydriticus]SDM20815.1 dnaA protein helix-turn-helix [Geoalkalibacter ferrihydriticus]
MQNLSFRYTRWVNWRHNRSGHLFQGRYKAVLVETDAYLVQLIGYLHLNPLRAGMGTVPGDYPWSSHRAYLGLETIPWLTTRLALSQLSGDPVKARRLFDDLVADQYGEGHREEFHGGNCDGRILGQDAFVETVLRKTGEVALTKPGLAVILTAVEKLYDLGDKDLSGAGQGRKISEARAMAAWAVRELSDATLTDLGGALRRDVTSLSSAARRLTTRTQADADLQLKISRLRVLVDKFASSQA